MGLRTCAVKGCGGGIAAMGFCDMHYRRVKRGRGVGPPKALVRTPTPQERRRMISLYGTLQSTKAVGESTGFSAEAVRMTLHRSGIDLAPAGSGTQMEVDESFFDKWTPEMAWVLGLYWTDGNLQEDGAISLTSKDRDLLEKVRTLLGGEQKLDHRYVRYRFNSVTVGDRLRELGMTPRKSLTVGFPGVPKNCLRHFMRGVFDGDGSVHWISGKDNAPKLSFSTGSKRMKAGIVRTLRERGYRVLPSCEEKRVPSSRQGRTRVQGHCWNINVNRISDIVDFYSWVYDGSSDATRCRRKRESFRMYFGRYLRSRDRRALVMLVKRATLTREQLELMKRVARRA